MATSYARRPYKERREAGFEYQDFIAMRLLQVGVVVQVFASLKFQLRHGESLNGIEIKYDSLMGETHNLAIETAEKSEADSPIFKPSGIYRDDNTWLYVQGDYRTIYIFCVTMLKMLHKRGSGKGQPYCEKTGATFKVFLLPVAHAEKYAARVIRVKAEAQLQTPMETVAA